MLTFFESVLSWVWPLLLIAAFIVVLVLAVRIVLREAAKNKAASASQAQTDPSAMGWLEGHAWGFGVWLVPAIFCTTIGGLFEGFSGLLEGAILWTGIFAAVVWNRRGQNTVLTVERMGRFWAVKFGGLRVVIPLLDVVVLDDDLFGKSVELLLRKVEKTDKDGKKTVEYVPEDINFQNGPAPVRADGWFQIARAEDIAKKDWNAVRDYVKRYTYRFKQGERGPRIADIFNGTLRPRLGEKTIDDARGNLDKVSEDATGAADKDLNALGVSILPGEGIIIHGVDLTEEEKRALEQRLEGTVEADKAKNASRQYWEPFMLLREGMIGKKGADFNINDPTDQGLLAMYMQRKNLETIRDTKTNITFFARDMEGVNSSLLINSHKQASAGAQ